jgi:hypothetical protein
MFLLYKKIEINYTILCIPLEYIFKKYTLDTW